MGCGGESSKRWGWLRVVAGRGVKEGHEGQASALEAQGGSREAKVAGPRRIWGSEECNESSRR